MRTRHFLTGLTALVVTSAAFATLRTLHPFQDAPLQATEHHHRILKGVGEWEGTFKMWMPGMDEAMEAPCSESVRGVGEFWTVSDFRMDFMGQAFSGASSLGYDTQKKKYVGTWLDSMTTALTVMEGEWNADKGAIVMTYDMFEPAAGEMVQMRSETTLSDPDVYDSTFYRVADGEDVRQMQITMKRMAGEAHEAGGHR